MPDGSDGGWPPPPPFAGGGTHYRSPVTPARVVAVFLALSAFASAVLVGSSIAEYRLITLVLQDPAAISMGQLDASDLRQVLLQLVTGALLLPAGIAFLVWCHRAYANLPGFGARRLRFAPGWAIGAWFVPILSLIRPKQIVDDIWRASSPSAPSGPAAWRGRSVPAAFHAWWALWVAGSLLWVVISVLDQSTELSTLRLRSMVLATAELMLVGAAILAARVVLATTARQEHLAKGAPSSLRAPRTGVLAAVGLGAVVLAGLVAFATLPSYEPSGVALAQRDGSETIQESGAVRVDQLQVGDCFQDAAELWSGDAAVLSVHAVPCDTPHDNQVFAMPTLDGARGAPYPGDAALLERSDTACVTAFERRFGAELVTSDYDVWVFFPTADQWILGDRGVWCILYRFDGGRLTGPVEAVG